MQKVQPSMNDPFNITECPICTDKRPMGSLYRTVHFGMFLAINVWLCCRDNPCLLHNVPISVFHPPLVFMLGIQSLVHSSKKHQFHCTWSGSLISFIGPNCTSVDAVCKKKDKNLKKNYFSQIHLSLKATIICGLSFVDWHNCHLYHDLLWFD